jgi:hypothetical protein
MLAFPRSGAAGRASLISLAAPEPEKGVAVAHACGSGADYRSEPPKQRTLSGASRNARRANVRSTCSFRTGLPDPVQKTKPQAPHRKHRRGVRTFR